MRLRSTTIVVVVVIAVVLAALYFWGRTSVISHNVQIPMDTTGVRDIIRDGKTCKEYFRLRDSRVVKTVCPP